MLSSTSAGKVAETTLNLTVMFWFLEGVERVKLAFPRDVNTSYPNLNNSPDLDMFHLVWKWASILETFDSPITILGASRSTQKDVVSVFLLIPLGEKLVL